MFILSANFLYVLKMVILSRFCMCIQGSSHKTKGYTGRVQPCSQAPNQLSYCKRRKWVPPLCYSFLPWRCLGGGGALLEVACMSIHVHRHNSNLRILNWRLLAVINGQDAGV